MSRANVIPMGVSQLESVASLWAQNSSAVVAASSGTSPASSIVIPANGSIVMSKAVPFTIASGQSVQIGAGAVLALI